MHDLKNLLQTSCIKPNKATVTSVTLNICQVLNSHVTTNETRCDEHNVYAGACIKAPMHDYLHRK